jgi:hypothetical protein
MRKIGVLQLTLQLSFWIVMTICNSIFELQWPFATHYISTLWMLLDKLHELQKLLDSSYIQCNSLQLNCNFVRTIPLQLLCNFLDYNHNVMLTSFFIHSSKFNTWNYENFGGFFWNIDIHHPLWLFILDGLDYHTWQNRKLPCSILIEF